MYFLDRYSFAWNCNTVIAWNIIYEFWWY